MPCCHNQWVKPAMPDLTDERSLNLKLQDRIKACIQLRFCSSKAETWLQKSVLRILEQVRKLGWPQTKSLLQLIRSISRTCKIGQALKSGLLGNDKNGLIKSKTIRVLVRPVFLWFGTLHWLYQTLPRDRILVTLWDTLPPLAVFLTNGTCTYLHSQAWRMLSWSFYPILHDDACFLSLW